MNKAASCGNGFVDMDQLTTAFTKESMRRQVDDCQDIEQLRHIAKLLLSAHFASKQMIGTLLLQDWRQPMTPHRSSSHAQDLRSDGQPPALP